MNSTKENLDRLFESMEAMSDVQEKCNMWNQITVSGRKECTKSKKEFYSNMVKWVNDLVIANGPDHN
ncbi:hypothetical protein QKC54_gp0972 [Megavirus baoshan]|uniref:Uncharacterized protein n=1 Tax=Megavirus baoshan TaxID=2496520 RepID=A0A8K1W864_9VIRU|nr:hypothetical protein QKC54_gp0972 [Megavirus baoshan]UFX99732.1 hypothetical protein Mb0100 [Megavirus baoshan]